MKSGKLKGGKLKGEIAGMRGDIYIDEFAVDRLTRRAYRKSYGFIHRRNLPVEVFRTERPLGRFLRRLRTAALPGERKDRKGART